MSKDGKTHNGKKASDNIYFHLDFHIAMNIVIDYLEKKYGISTVKEYLKEFASYYKNLKEKIKKKGFSALKKYIEQLYKKENGKIDIQYEKDAMIVSIKKCPAISHIRKMGYTPADSFFETTRTFYETILDSTDYKFEILNYNKKTGKVVFIFRKKR